LIKEEQLEVWIACVAVVSDLDVVEHDIQELEHRLGWGVVADVLRGALKDWDDYLENININLLWWQIVKNILDCLIHLLEQVQSLFSFHTEVEPE
jgi:hypothetical protein